MISGYDNVTFEKAEPTLSLDIVHRVQCTIGIRILRYIRKEEKSVLVKSYLQKCSDDHTHHTF